MRRLPISDRRDSGRQIAPRAPAPSANTDAPTEIDVLEAVSTAHREPCGSASSWVFTNMVTSLDGAASLDGTSGGLGNDDDRRLFAGLRATADLILVGAGTVRAERYRLPRLPTAPLAELRAQRSQPAPRLCIVSASLDLEPDLPFLEELRNPGENAEGRAVADGTCRPPVLITTAKGAERASADLRQLCEIAVAGEHKVDMVRALADLRDDGFPNVLCEGGPSLLAQLAVMDLIDEWNLTLSPRVVGGLGERMLTGKSELFQTLTLEQLLISDDSTLLARYVRSAH